MFIQAPTHVFEVNQAGELLYPIDNGEPLANDTTHLSWITFLKNGLEDWFADRSDVFVAADLLWYPVEGRPDISRAPDVMVVLEHPAGDRNSYMQWREANRPPTVVFEFVSQSNSAGEMMEKLDFYSDHGCDEFYIYDYRRAKFQAFHRSGGHLVTKPVSPDGNWHSQALNMVFGLKGKDLWVQRPDGKLMETQRQILQRAEVEAKRAEAEAKRAEAEAKRAEVEAKRAEAADLRAQAEAMRADKLAEKLRAMGIDPDALGG